VVELSIGQRQTGKPGEMSDLITRYRGHASPFRVVKPL
jgi:hypothetical protein